VFDSIIDKGDDVPPTIYLYLKLLVIGTICYLGILILINELSIIQAESVNETVISDT